MKIKCTLTFIILVLSINTKAQNKFEKLNISAKYHKGILMSHNKSIYDAAISKIYGYEINIGYTPTKSQWSHNYSFPEIGIGIMHESLGNKEVLGYSTAIFPYINFGIIQKQKFNVHLHLGLGLSYTNKKFDAVKNYKNIAISSNINAFVLANLNAEYMLNKYIAINTGLGVNHLSNGSSNRPNRGLNVLTYNLGVKAYIYNNKTSLPTQKTNTSVINKHYLNISYLNGLRKAAIKDPHKYYAACLGINYVYQKNTKHKYGIGLDLFYDESTNRGTWNYKPDISLDYRLKQGLHVSHTLCVGDLGIYTEIGAYIHSKASTASAVYTRLGLDYNLPKNIILRLALKAHMAKADIIEVGLSYNINCF